MLLIILFPWLVGPYARQQFQLVRAGWELAERLEREQDLTAERMRLLERSRIASDMHDSLGHELSLIALRAATLQVNADPGDSATGPPASCGNPLPGRPSICGRSSESSARTANPPPCCRPTTPSPA